MANPKILLVEDEVFIAMHEKQQLESYGYAVRHVGTGEAAVKTVLEESLPVDIILMDINLGDGIDGTQAAEEILKHRDIPIVFLSSHSEPEVVEKTEKITSYGYVVKNSGFVVLDTSIKMAIRLFDEKAERKRAIQLAMLNEENYRFQFMNMNSYNSLYEILTDEDGRPYDFRFLMVNRAYEEYVGKKASELVGRTLLEVYPDTEQYWIEKMAEAALSDRPIHFESFSQVMNTYTEINLYIPQKGQLAMTTANIDERKRAEDALHESERTFRKLFEDSADAILLIDKTGVFVECNQAALNMLKMTREQFLLSPPEKISPEYQPNGRKSADLVPEMNGIAYEKGLNRFDWTCVDAAGKEFIVEVSLMPIVLRGQTMLHTTWRDITERKKAQEEIRLQLSEKELLLREVHHRVKNTIANIEGLLAFQAESTDDRKIKDALNDTLSRVQSMRILYERLLLSGNYSEIPVKAYMESIVDSLLEVYNYKKNITIEKNIGDFGLSSKKAESLGIIASELLTNAFKYGMDGGGAVNVSLSVGMEENAVGMTVRDKGIGIQYPSEKQHMSGFGLTIVRLLVEQMQGTFTFTTQNGTTCAVRFPGDGRK